MERPVCAIVLLFAMTGIILAIARMTWNKRYDRFLRKMFSVEDEES